MFDETEQLQTLINNTPLNGSLTLERNWNCNGTVTITQPIRIFFNGFYIKAITDLSETLDGTSTARLNRRARAHLRIKDTDSVELINPWIIGAHPNGGFTDDAYDPDAEAQHAFDILNASNVYIYDAVASDVWGDFIYIGKGSSYVTVDGLHGRRNGRQGIAVSSGTDITFMRLDLDLVRRTMIDLEPNKNSETVDRVLIDDCTLGEARLNFLSCSSAAGHIGNVTLRNITSVMPFRSNIGSELVQNRGPFYLSNIHHVKWHGSPQQICLKVINVNNLIVNNCTFPTQPGRGMRFVKTEGTCSNIVVSNTKLPNAVDVAHPTSGAVLEYANSVGAGPTVLPL